MPPSPKTPSLLGSPQRKRQPEPPAARAEPLRWYEVLEDRTVPVSKGSTVLRAGKVINTGGYDMAVLRGAGVKLREVPTPQWFVDQQATSEDRHRALVEAGAELGDHPAAYEPNPVSAANLPDPPQG